MPTDPYSLPQAYQRWLYQDYAYWWTQQSEATRRAYAADGSRFHLTGYQYWMKYHLTNLPDIAALWYLDEKAGAIAHDSARNANHGTIFGATPTPGIIDGCQHFDGINDVIDFGHTPSLDFHSTDCFTILIRLYRTGWDLYDGILTKSTGNLYQLLSYGYTVTWTDDLRFDVADGVGGIAVTAPLPYNQWTPYAAVLDPTDLLIYQDGSFVASVARTRNPLSIPNHLYMGDWPLQKNYDGLIDHCIIYNRPLDATEIAMHAQRSYPE